MKKIVLLFLSFAVLFSFAIADESQAETAVKMPYRLFAENRILMGEYTGEILNGVPHGYGVFSFDIATLSPSHYVGEWSNGEMCGKGGLYCDNGESQVGTFEQNSMVCGEIRSQHTAWRYINFTPNEHGCFEIIDTLEAGTAFQGCMNPETGLYHKGTMFTPQGNIEIDTGTKK